jgi:hypothetical protein
MKRSREIQNIEDDIALHRKTYRWKIIGKSVLVLLTLAALAGLLGSGGPASRQRINLAPGLQLEYERFLRYKGSSELLVNCYGPLSGSDTLQLAFSHEFQETFTLENIQPRPSRMEVNALKTVYSFPANAATFQVRFEVKPRRFGSSSFQLSSLPDREYLLHQLIYP